MGAWTALGELSCNILGAGMLQGAFMGMLGTYTKVGSITDLPGIAVGWVSCSQMHQG